MSAADQAIQPVIQVQHLAKRYGKTQALNGLDMQVERGSIYGFVGPNGAGKTTTMRILATLLEADAGTGRIAGEDIREHPARARGHLGFMPDFFGVYEDLTVVEYLDFYAASYGIPARRRRTTIAELLELVDLSHKRDDFVEGLSRGMKQRLGLARCLVHEPDVLLLDEPASGMDPRARYEMREIVRELQRLGTTVLVSSHILPELADMCTHIGIIQHGRLVREGPVEQVLRGMNPGRTIAIQVLGPPATALETLEHLPEVSEVVATPEPAGEPDAAGAGPREITFRTFEDDAGLREILRALVSADAGVIHFAQQLDNLEEVFMQLTERTDS
jgi:ABC-2 type transport system ATP-binding protein